MGVALVLRFAATDMDYPSYRGGCTMINAGFVPVFIIISIK
jgi:hypothetical protein